MDDDISGTICAIVNLCIEFVGDGDMDPVLAAVDLILLGWVN